MVIRNLGLVMVERVRPAISPRRFLASSPIAQFALLLIIWFVGCKISEGTGIPVPGPVLGLVITLVLLATGVLDLSCIDDAAGWLISEMLLFFVPAVIALVVHPELIGLLGIKVLAVIVISTVLVMIVTSLVIEYATKMIVREVVGEEEEEDSLTQAEDIYIALRTQLLDAGYEYGYGWRNGK
ncbi:CidA/LrgA family protein [Propionibacterium sp.]|uniref:CidA/LrgA family protein n=1 Tax=Propionibacterium sp. TaxID=1977903 RepID=UPI0039E75B48